jgi:hypothetical protein
MCLIFDKDIVQKENKLLQERVKGNWMIINNDFELIKAVCEEFKRS